MAHNFPQTDGQHQVRSLLGIVLRRTTPDEPADKNPAFIEIVTLVDDKLIKYI